MKREKIQILQRVDQKKIAMTKCLILETGWGYHCGFDSIAYAPKNLYYKRTKYLSPEECGLAAKEQKVRIDGKVFDI